MALEFKKPSDLPVAASVLSNAAIMVDNAGIVQQATPQQVVNTGRPISSESQAIAGSDNTTAMTPLSTKQAIDSAGGGIIGLAQAWAESPTPPGGTGTKSAKTWASDASIMIASVFPPSFDENGRYYSRQIDGVPEDKLPLDLAVTFATDTNEGVIARIAGPQSLNRIITRREYIPAVVGRKYRMTVRARHVGAFVGSSASCLFLIMRRVSSAFVQSGDIAGFNPTFAAPNTWYNFVVEGVHDGATPYLAPTFFTNNLLNVTGPAIEFSKFFVEDISDTVSEPVNVASFLAGRTDQQAFQAAVNSLPTASTFTGAKGTLNTGEIPTFEIVVPRKSANASLDPQEFYVLADHLKIGNRDVIWNVDADARIGSTNNSFGALNSKVLYRGNIHLNGFNIQNNRTNLTLTQGNGALGYGGMLAGISGYSPNTVETQAFQHERGAANAYLSNSGNEILVPGTGVNYTSTTINFATPLAENVSDNIRIGMLVDTVGNMLTGTPVRHTTRITGISFNTNDEITGFQVEPFQRMKASPAYTSGELSIPPNGTALVINPVNKLWSVNANLFLTKTNGAIFGHTSGSVWESGIFNNTGKRAGEDFARDDHPFHIWAVDMSHVGENGGGISYMSRAKANVTDSETGLPMRWSVGYESRGADVGFHNRGTLLNDGGIGFVASAGNLNPETGQGVSRVDFCARSLLGVEYDEHFQVVGGAPYINLGRRSTASAPRINFYTDGLAGSDDALWDAQIIADAGGTGTLRLNARAATIFDVGANEKLRVNSSGAVVTGLLSGTAVVQSTADVTPGRVLTTAAGPAQAYRQGNLLGTVSTAAGVPTGAVIERGANANGAYTRFADGTQICFASLTVTQAIATAHVGGFRNAGQTWTFPIAFAADPIISGAVRSLNSMGFVTDTLSASGVNVYHTAVTSQTSALLTVGLSATGRWF